MTAERKAKLASEVRRLAADPEARAEMRCVLDEIDARDAARAERIERIRTCDPVAGSSAVEVLRSDREKRLDRLAAARRREALREFVDSWEAEHGPFTAQELARAAEWMRGRDGQPPRSHRSQPT